MKTTADDGRRPASSRMRLDLTLPTWMWKPRTASYVTLVFRRIFGASTAALFEV